MKRAVFLSVVTMFFLGCKHKDQVKKAVLVKDVSKTESKETKQKEKAKKEKKRVVKQTIPVEDSYKAAFQAIDGVCGMLPTPVDALFFAPKSEVTRDLKVMAEGLDHLTGLRGARRFYMMLHKRFGVSQLDKLQGVLVAVSGGKVVVFFKGIGLDTEHRELYKSGAYTFVMSKQTKWPVLTGKLKQWVVMGPRDLMLRLAQMDPKDLKPVCERMKKEIEQKMGPNIHRDPFKTGVGFIPGFFVTLFWDSSRGMRVLVPTKGNSRVIKKITGFIKGLKTEFGNKMAESDAGAPPLRPVDRLQSASLIPMSMQTKTRANTLLIDARGNLFNLILATYQDMLKPFLGRRR